jgi:L-seryl-tRNA(Ser) seleniumtransferase
LRAIPAVSAVLARPAIAELVGAHGHATVVAAIRASTERARAAVLAGGNGEVADEEVCARVARAAAGTLRPVVNATGVLVHTNLGRAPLAEEALRAIDQVGRGYATVEYDLEEGGRGDRSAHAASLLRELTLAEDALVVNNNAAALLLVLSALAAGREVVVSRGELVEIGGGFRVPEVLVQSGARLVEVGTTNRTHRADYERAIGEGTGLLLKVHRSNFTMLGYTAEVDVPAMVEIADARGVPFAYDAGSGAIRETEAGEPTVASIVRAGAHVVTFSGDKLLGGPQAGIIVGRRALLEKMRRHPLMRALRPDKTCLAALQTTLRLWRDAPERIPIVRMQRAATGALAARASNICAELSARGVGARVVASKARVGGGAAPTRDLESRAVRIEKPGADALARSLRASDPPVIARVEDGAVILDLRTVDEADDAAIVAAVARKEP